MAQEQEMLDFVKALAHEDRLKIVGALVQRPARIADLRENLSLTTRELFKALAFLEHVGVIHKKGDLYELDTQALQILARSRFKGKR
jgi:predicted transcriptional regulator